MLCSWPSTSGINYVVQLAPAAWYRYGMGITSSGGLVSAWADQSGNDNHLEQATGTNQPSHESDGSILFDGVDNYLKAVAFTLTQPETIYILFQQITWTFGERVFDGNTLNTGTLYQSDSDPELNIYAGTDPLLHNSGLPLNTYGVVGVVLNGASSILQINNSVTVTGNAGASNMSGFTLGTDGNISGLNAHIQVKEVLIYSAAHDADTRTRVIRYLAHVGGIAV